MSVAQELQVKDAVGPHLAALVPALAGEKLNKAIGVEATQVFKNHYYELNGQRHRGITTTGFYEEAAKATHYDSTPSGVRITTSKQGVAQRLQGGPIVAGAGGSGKKYLTIPATLYYGAKGALEFQNLEVAWGHQKWAGGKIGPIGLKVADKAKYKKGQKTPQVGDMAYWLVPSVVQKPDPGVLPPLAKLQEGLDRAVKSYLSTIK